MWAFLSALLLALSLAGQESRHEEIVSVGYVMVPFTAYSAKGVPVTNLRQKDVTLQVDGLPVKTDLFERSMNAPISFTILLDGSGSMGLAGKMEGARAAIAALLSQRIPGDDFALYVFSDAQAREVVPFTENGNAVLAALPGIKPFGKTAFFDALTTMPERGRLGKNPSRAIILLSDGIDNASRIRRSQLPALLESVAIPIFHLGMRHDSATPAGKNREELSDFELLESVTSLTGGRIFPGDKPEQLQSAARELTQGLRAQYLVGFSPTGRGGVKYRRISLKLGGRGLKARSRAGYRGTEPPTQHVAVRAQS